MRTRYTLRWTKVWDACSCGRYPEHARRHKQRARCWETATTSREVGGYQISYWPADGEHTAYYRVEGVVPVEKDQLHNEDVPQSAHWIGKAATLAEAKAIAQAASEGRLSAKARAISREHRVVIASLRAHS